MAVPLYTMPDVSDREAMAVPQYIIPGVSDQEAVIWLYHSIQRLMYPTRRLLYGCTTVYNA